MEKTYKKLSIHILIVLAIILLATISLQASFAANQTINNSTGINTGITNTGAGDTLTLQEGIYNKSTDRGITINKNITIQGNTSTNNVIIDAQKLSGIFTIGNGYNVTFINITFINGNKNTGAAITSAGANSKITIMNCVFKNNTVSNTGAAVFIRDSAYIVNCTFVNNTSNAYGGAITIYNNSYVVNSIFIGNTATYGGAAFVGTTPAYTNLHVINSTFTNNTAKTSGGAIYIQNANASVINSTFNNNNGSIGGAIYSGGNSTISGNVMSGNFANLGNMIYNTGRMGVLNLTFINNSTINVLKNQNVFLFATLTDDMGNTVTGQNISFYVNGVLVGSVTSIEGSANLTYLVNFVGVVPVNGTYAGSGTYSINRLNGQLNSTLITNSTIVVPNTNAGQSMNITGVATGHDGSPLANTQLTVVIDGVTFTVTTDSTGLWILSYTPLREGLFDLSVSWNGNSTHNGFTNTTVFSVPKIPSNTTVNAPDTNAKKAINITGVAIDDNGDPLANAELTIIINGETFTVTTDSDGVWILTYTPTDTGVFDVSVSFAGNNTHFNFTNTTSFNVGKINSHVTINTPSDAKAGKETTISGNLTDEFGNPVANADLEVIIDGETFNVKTDANGIWSLKYTPKRIGTINIEATFNGDNIHIGSTNNTTFNVTKRNIIVKITIKENEDGSITIIANATYEDDGSPAVNYPVDFILDGELIGTGITDENGIAILTIPASKITNGTHKITVIVHGNDNVNGGEDSVEFTRKTPRIDPITPEPPKPEPKNVTNKTTNNPAAKAAMKNTGIPIIPIIIALFSLLGITSLRKKRENE